MWIYKIVEIDTSEILYVGKTYTSLKKRFDSHLSKWKYGISPFSMYIQSIGEDAIEISIIDTASSENELLTKERKWIRQLNPPFNMKKPSDDTGIKWQRLP